MMKTTFRTPLLAVTVAVLAGFAISPVRNLLADPANIGGRKDAESQVKLVHISAIIDGSGRMVFAGPKVHYEHKHWAKPENVVFDDIGWPQLDQAPAGWAECAGQLDLTKAWIVKRSGRDIVALETTPEGFDLYFSDSPDGAGQYELTIAIPRRR